MATQKPNLRLLGGGKELLIAIDARSWGVLSEPDLFPEGLPLFKTFGVTWSEPSHGILQHMPVTQFYSCCQTVWQSLLRDKELLSYSYLYEFGSEKGVRHGGGVGGGFHVRGMVGLDQSEAHRVLHPSPPIFDS